MRFQRKTSGLLKIHFSQKLPTAPSRSSPDMLTFELVLFFFLGELANKAASIIAWRLIETHLFRVTVRKFYAAPALAEHANFMLLPIALAKLKRGLNR
jgi:hypothetical protein